ncbi:MAG: transposase [Candidatus Binatota bacterium]|nr:transposase [Candidatus Binatota bacterium]
MGKILVRRFSGQSLLRGRGVSKWIVHSAFKNGTTHVVMSPLEFMQRLAALVPRPRLHLIRFHGVLAPNAKLRREIDQADRSNNGIFTQLSIDMLAGSAIYFRP